MKPHIDAFFNALINWKITNGISIVSLNHVVPLNPCSTKSITVKNMHQTAAVLITLNALNVLNPSRLAPAITPKNPSKKTTAINAKYCSEYVIVKLKKYVQINDMVVDIDNVIASADVFI